MENIDSSYVAIDLKSFFASVECVRLGLDPLNVALVVADKEKTYKTICLAITPPLKKFGLSGRARLFEVSETVQKENKNRLKKLNLNSFEKKSYFLSDFETDKTIGVDYIVASPKMNLYLEYSQKIYNIYLKYVSPSDIYRYSIDEVFINVKPYLKLLKTSAENFVTKIVDDVYNTTGITATVGIGSNIFLAKVAMDIISKKAEPNRYGLRIGNLSESSFKELLWDYKPISDFWMIGASTQKKLNKIGIFTMRDLAVCSKQSKTVFPNIITLKNLFGVLTEQLIEHSYGKDSTSISDLINYIPKDRSIGNSQVLLVPYTWDRAMVVLKEMAEKLAFDLFNKNSKTKKIEIEINYDTSSVDNKELRENPDKFISDRYSRIVPKPDRATFNLNYATFSIDRIRKGCAELYEKTVNKNYFVRKLAVRAIVCKENTDKKDEFFEGDLFESESISEEQKEEKYFNLQKAVVKIKNKYGNNAVLKGMNFEDGATQRKRNIISEGN